MIATLMSVPGRLKAIYDKLVADLPSTVSSRIDTAVSNIAPASSYTAALATELSSLSSAMSGIASETTPCLDVPIAGGFTDSEVLLSGYVTDGGGVVTYARNSTSLGDAVNYTGAGVLELCGIQTTGTGTGRIVITIDGVSIYDFTTTAGQYRCCCPVGAATEYMFAFGRVPFKTSLRIQTASGTSGQYVDCFYKFYKT